MVEVLKSYSRLGWKEYWGSEASEATPCSNYAVQSISKDVHGRTTLNTPDPIKVLVKYITLQKEEIKCCVWCVFMCVVVYTCAYVCKPYENFE